MPFKSKAQRRKFAQLLVEGKITPEIYEEWNRETGGTHLPERVEKPKKAARRKKKATARRTSRTRLTSGKSKAKKARKRSRRS